MLKSISLENVVLSYLFSVHKFNKANCVVIYALEFVVSIKLSDIM